MELTQNITKHDLFMFMTVAFIVGCIATVLALFLGKKASSLMSKLPYTKVVWCIIIFVTILVFFLTGWLGFLVLVISTCIGLMPPLVNVKRSHNMGCLLLPVMLFFLL